MKNTELQKELNLILSAYIGQPFYMVGVDVFHRESEPPYWEEGIVAGFVNRDNSWCVCDERGSEFELVIDYEKGYGATLSKEEAMQAFKRWGGTKTEKFIEV